MCLIIFLQIIIIIIFHVYDIDYGYYCIHFFSEKNVVIKKTDMSEAMGRTEDGIS